jgi:hypothetical protein
MTSSELRRSAWRAGLAVVATVGVRVVRLTRTLPDLIELQCRACGMGWLVRTNARGEVRLTRGRGSWRACPRGCNAEQRRRG